MQGVSQIRLYLEDKPGVQEELALLQTHLNQFRTQHPKLPLGSLAVDTTAMQDEDWENNWKQYYTPIAIGERLIVLPQWLAEETKTDRIPIILDPGMIFGTGAHASTQMCLGALEQLVQPGDTVLDPVSYTHLDVYKRQAQTVGIFTGYTPCSFLYFRQLYNHIQSTMYCVKSQVLPWPGGE